MYKAKITSVSKNKTTLNYTVEFYKDDILIDTQTIHNIDPSSSIAPWASQQISMFEGIDSVDTSTLIGDVVLATNGSTQYEVEKQKLMASKVDLDLGIIAQDEYNLQLNIVKALK